MLYIEKIKILLFNMFIYLKNACKDVRVSEKTFEVPPKPIILLFLLNH